MTWETGGAPRNAGTQARRHAGTQARRQTTTNSRCADSNAHTGRAFNLD
ncbi:hypothetical protein NP80_5568 [Burkholderia multivorans ATCC BAA-247]|nr:hypothetical protein NP80_5568 [Burkholderia multivorans ATCC BAA-247]